MFTGQTELVDHVVNMNTPLDIQSPRSESSLHASVRSRELDLMNRFASSELINAPNQCGRTALILATFKGSVNIVSYLIQRGASVDIADKDGLTALSIAVYYCGHGNIIRALLDRKADPTIPDVSGRNTLDWISNSPKLVEIFGEVAKAHQTSRIGFVLHERPGSPRSCNRRPSSDGHYTHG